MTEYDITSTHRKRIIIAMERMLTVAEAISYQHYVKAVDPRADPIAVLREILEREDRRIPPEESLALHPGFWIKFDLLLHPAIDPSQSDAPRCIARSQDHAVQCLEEIARTVIQCRQALAAADAAMRREAPATASGPDRETPGPGMQELQRRYPDLLNHPVTNAVLRVLRLNPTIIWSATAMSRSDELRDQLARKQSSPKSVNGALRRLTDAGLAVAIGAGTAKRWMGQAQDSL